MSRKLNLSELTEQEVKQIEQDLVLEIAPSKYAFNTRSTYIPLFYQHNDHVYVPFAYKPYPRPERSAYNTISVEFTGQLRPHQKQVRQEAINLINRDGSVLISSYPGYGKTAMAINLATKIGLQTMVICHRVILINQWKESILKFCPSAKIQVVSSKTELNNADFYIMNAINVDKNPIQCYSKIGLVIIDEAHIIMAEKMSNCMRCFLPRYVIGLSATPYRNDALNILLSLYFGQQIHRQLHREHIVYKVETNFQPEPILNKMGKIDWSAIIEQQCDNEQRNNLIIDIILKEKDRVFLVLCKRVNQANYLEQKLKEHNQEVTSLIGSNQIYEPSARILIGTSGKIGTGFDHPRLNTLLLASDVEQYFIQYLGRVFRREDTIPVIFDLVDDFPLLHKHYRTRKEVYIQHGGQIRNY